MIKWYGEPSGTGEAEGTGEGQELGKRKMGKVVSILNDDLSPGNLPQTYGLPEMSQI